MEKEEVEKLIKEHTKSRFTLVWVSIMAVVSFCFVPVVMKLIGRGPGTMWLYDKGSVHTIHVVKYTVNLFGNIQYRTDDGAWHNFDGPYQFEFDQP